ncbi:hypothetical protein [Halomarina oriensis]|uniref:Uncharacterized protein n=1 Tax=Halomarina oriensis TaxID=671145 RepID=A0A6B0GW37_9EURY|nr:hypothetical protein [Halomarina oriensis]MWG36793.1 hypothetical protein [Halomarina oriensis]
MCHRNTTEEYAYYVLGERETTDEREDDDRSLRVDGEATRIVRQADD